ncbi:MAG: OmpA family protein, partial [Pseudomonadota bacterium]
IAAAVAWFVNAAVALWWSVDRITETLEAQAQAALADAGAGWVEAAVDGRDATLFGLSSGAEDETTAAAVVAGVWGVRGVETRFDRAPARSFAMRLRRDFNGALSVSGALPDDAARAALDDALPFADWRDLTTTGGPPAPDGFAAAVAYAGRALNLARAGRADLIDDRIVIRPELSAARAFLDDPPAGWRLDWRAPGAGADCEAAMARAAATRPIRFAVGEAALDAPAFRTVSAVAAAARDCPEYGLRVDWHTDATGDPDFNYALSWRRADAVARALRAQGVAGARVTRRGFGPDVPIADNAEEDGRAANRRIEFTIIPAAPES